MNARNIPERFLWTLIVLSTLFIMSCSKEGKGLSASDDYLIFGKYFGLCMGEECVETYKLTSTQLFEDREDTYFPPGEYDFELLSEELFEKVKDLKDQFPSRLLDEESQTFGCPNCYDQGEYFIEIPYNGETKSWRVDTNLDDIPTYLHEFVRHIDESISALKN
jgi:hypothetical protein